MPSNILNYSIVYLMLNLAGVLMTAILPLYIIKIQTFVHDMHGKISKIIKTDFSTLYPFQHM